MKIKLTAGKLNESDNSVTPSGTIIDVDQAEAERLVGLNVAVYEEMPAQTDSEESQEEETQTQDAPDGGNGEPDPLPQQEETATPPADPGLDLGAQPAQPPVPADPLSDPTLSQDSLGTDPSSTQQNNAPIN